MGLDVPQAVQQALHEWAAAEELVGDAALAPEPAQLADAVVLLLILAGLGDVMSKFHEEWGSHDLTEGFLFFIFLTACTLCLGVTAY